MSTGPKINNRNQTICCKSCGQKGKKKRKRKGVTSKTKKKKRE
jgi:hypothetical protein